MFSWTLPVDAPYYYGTWLGELWLYVVYRVGGLHLTTFVRTLLLGITFWLVGWEARRRSGSWRIAAFVVALGFIMTLSNVHVRTQIWSWLPFIIFLILLSRYSDHSLSRNWLLILPFLMALWVNLHGAFILGLVLLGIYLLGNLLVIVFRLPGELNKKDVIWLAVISLLSALATLFNPRFIGIVDYVMDLMTDKPSQQLIIEWQSPTPQGFVNITFYLSILILMICLAYTKHLPSPTEILTIVAFLWLAWSGLRYIVWYGIAIMPILSQVLSRLPINLPTFEIQRHRRNVLIALLLLIPVILVQPWFVEKFPLPETYWKQVVRGAPDGPLLSVENPIAAVEYLVNNPGGNLFNEMGYGSYLIWALPQQKVFVDPRVELYPFEQWKDYIRITRGADYNRLLEHYGADRLLLSKERQSDLVDILHRDPIWQLEYEDQYTQIWKKVSHDNP